MAKTFEDVQDEGATRFKQIACSPHGGLYALTNDGRLFERIPDPSPNTGPGPKPFVWKLLEGVA